MDTLFAKTKQRMEKCVDSLENDFASIRAGRANTAILNKVRVDYYGTPTPVNEVASITVSEATNLIIKPWDSSLLKVIERAINESDIGINPQNDGQVLRLLFPKLTEDRRKEICKDISKRAESAKVAMRSVRRDSIDEVKKMKKNNEITEDDVKNAEKKIQDITDKFTKLVDEISQKKEKEILSL